jgi:membrane-associated protease RseP (regulator of RpoE activity)
LINLFPIPVLDGGHIVLATIESARGGKPVPEAMIKPIFVVFVVLLIGMMIFITVFADFPRYILPKAQPAPSASQALKGDVDVGKKEVKP